MKEKQYKTEKACLMLGKPSHHMNQIKNKTKHKCTKRRQKKNQFSQRHNIRDSHRGRQILEGRKRLYFMGRDSISILFP